MRIKWWADPSKMTYIKISLHPNDDLPEGEIDLLALKDTDYYKEDDKSVFFGHYWLEEKPSLYKGNICCLDYSVANKGYLAAYSFDDEPILDGSKFVFV